MSDLKQEISQVKDNFDSTSPDKIIELVIAMKPSFRSDDVREYLDGKLQGFSNMSDSEKLEFSKQFRPYFTWFLNE